MTSLYIKEWLLRTYSHIFLLCVYGQLVLVFFYPTYLV